MPRFELLDDKAIAKFVSDNPLWEMKGNCLNRELVASNFVAAVGIVNSIAVLAEKLDHHPDILLYGWNKIRISSSTHDSGGITELDLKLATQIDDLNF